MSNKVTHHSGGIGFTGLLTLVFIVLKLTGYIAWSWWWVLSPLWLSAGFFLVLLAILLIVASLQSTKRR